MCIDFDLPRSYMFFYYQLRRAIRAQFSSLENPVHIPQLEKILRRPNPTKLISTYYAALMTDCNLRFRVAQTKWASMDITFSDDDWSEFSNTYKTSVISSRDRIINIKMFHLPHLTPARLHKMGLAPTADCFQECGQVADFLHWVGIGSFISSAVGLPNILHPKNCLLGIFGALHISSHARRLLFILHFYEKKVVLLSWKGSQIRFTSIQTHV